MQELKQSVAGASLSEARIKFSESAQDERTYEFLKFTAGEIIERSLYDLIRGDREPVIDKLASICASRYYRAAARMIETRDGNAVFIYNYNRGKNGAKSPDPVFYVSSREKEIALLSSSASLRSLEDWLIADTVDVFCKTDIYQRRGVSLPEGIRQRPNKAIDLSFTAKSISEGYWPNLKLVSRLRSAMKAMTTSGMLDKSAGARVAGITQLVQRQIDRTLPEFISSRWQSFIETLQPELVNALQNEGRLRIDDYNFCVSAASPERTLYRSQWCQSFPCFVYHQDSDLMEEVTPLIDDARPFNRDFAELHATSAALIKRLAGGGMDLFRSEESSRKWRELCAVSGTIGPRDLVQLLGDVPVSNVPVLNNSMEQDLSDMWLVINAHWEFAGAIVRGGGYSYSDRDKIARVDLARNLLQKSKGHWEKGAEFLREVGRDKARDTADFIKTFHRRVIAPVVMRSFLSEDFGRLEAKRNRTNLKLSEFTRLITENSNFTKLIGLSNKWHKTFSEEESGSSGDLYLEWEAVCEEQRDPGGYTLRALTSSSALKAEGAAMNHCVSGYSYSCATKGMHIISIRDAKDRRVGTLELKEAEKGVKEVQLRGRFNKPVSKSVKEAAKWLIQRINSEEIQVNFEELSEKRVTNGPSGICDFDFKDDQKCIDAYEAFSWALPGELRKLDWASFSEHPLIQKLVDDFMQELRSEID